MGGICKKKKRYGIIDRMVFKVMLRSFDVLATKWPVAFDVLVQHNANQGVAGK